MCDEKLCIAHMIILRQALNVKLTLQTLQKDWYERQIKNKKARQKQEIALKSFVLVNNPVFLKYGKYRKHRNLL